MAIYNNDKYSINVAHKPNVMELINWLEGQSDIIIMEG